MELIAISNPDEDHLTWAVLKETADKSIMKFKIGAALVKRGKILAVGHNSKKTHPRFGSKKEFMTMHAEGNLLYNAEKLGIDTKGCTIIVYRRNWLNSKPCESCQKLIKKSGISKVIYTNNE
jgi:deoxycytidylate deaminase